MDFTISTYCKLLDALQKQGFAFRPFDGFNEKPDEKVLILRQDVDRLPENSLRFAGIQAKRGIRGTYYFRIAPESWNVEIIREIFELGHEIGYHYEDLSFAWAKLRAQGSGLRAQGEELEKKVVDIGFELFKKNLENLRKIAPVKTICMHGSPLSKWDSKLLWKYYDYHDFEIIGEPYFDLDFDKVLYLTDTGRRWDGESFSIRDKATGYRLQVSGENPYKDWKVKPFNYRQILSDINVSPSPLHPLSPSSIKFHSTSNIIKAAEENKLPDKIMMTFHPQRWTDNPVAWFRELAWQNIKNTGKYYLLKINSFAKQPDFF